LDGIIVCEDKGASVVGPRDAILCGEGGDELVGPLDKHLDALHVGARPVVAGVGGNRVVGTIHFGRLVGRFLGRKKRNGSRTRRSGGSIGGFLLARERRAGFACGERERRGDDGYGLRRGILWELAWRRRGNTARTEG